MKAIGIFMNHYFELGETNYLKLEWLVLVGKIIHATSIIDGGVINPEGTAKVLVFRLVDRGVS